VISDLLAILSIQPFGAKLPSAVQEAGTHIRQPRPICVASSPASEPVQPGKTSRPFDPIIRRDCEKSSKDSLSHFACKDLLEFMQPCPPSTLPSVSSRPARHHLLGLDGVIPLREVALPLLLLLGDAALLVLGEGAAQGAGLLGPQVEGQILLLLVEEAQLVALGRVDDGQDAGDGLADVVAVNPFPLVSCVLVPGVQ
jgi:hypothetical protein